MSGDEAEACPCKTCRCKVHDVNVRFNAQHVPEEVCHVQQRSPFGRTAGLGLPQSLSPAEEPYAEGLLPRIGWIISKVAQLPGQSSFANFAI